MEIFKSFSHTDIKEQKAIKYFEANYKDYVDKYTPHALIEKIGAFAKKAGISFVYKALLLYYGLINENVPDSEKILAIAALGYFISPLDFIPDIIPGGLLDDGVILAFALKPIYSSLSTSTKMEAITRLHEWFGEFDETELPEV